MPEAPFKICFVCMGNICRSPIAENVFRHKVKQRGVEHLFFIDSAGTGGWHAGEPPDPRARRTATAHSVEMSGVARQIKTGDFDNFDLLLCMDQENLDQLIALGAPADRTRLLLSCDPNARCAEVPDPYYGGPDGFESVFQLIDSACDALLNDLLAQHKKK